MIGSGEEIEGQIPFMRGYQCFPAIRAYVDRIKIDCRRAGHVETIFGRKCFNSRIRDPNPARRAGAERQAIKAPLQGAAADIIKHAMARFPAVLARKG
jgi:DNA polymerase I